MRKIKKYISIIVAVQLACTSLMPIYATNGTQKDANNVYSESLNDSKSDNRLIIKFKDDKSKIKFKTAIDYDHEALMDSFYTNSQEVEDGIDNDENGYVDDIIGWDFINSTDISQT